MTTDAERISAALKDIALWYRDPGEASQGWGGPAVVGDGSSTPADTGQQWARLALVAVLVVVAFGLGSLVVNGLQSAPVDSGAIADDLDRAAVVRLCLDFDTPYDLDGLRSSGTVHSVGSIGDRERGFVLSTSSLHVACGLAQRDHNWFRAVSVAGTHQPLAAAEAVSVQVVVELRGKIYVTGQAGPEVESMSIERDGQQLAVEIDNGWWGGSFDATDLPIESIVPDFSVSWSTSFGSEHSSDGVDLLQERAWQLCAQSDECSVSRITELYELALGSGSADQAAALADRLVTEDEYRSMFRNWGSCIAQATGTTITYDANGLFVVQGSSSETAEAFEECKQQHAALIIEAVGLKGTVADE